MAEIGDMISYNVGGMLKCSAGVVLDKKVVADNRLGKQALITFYKIVWYRLGKYKPKPIQRYQISHKTDPKDVGFLRDSDGWMGASSKVLLNHPDWFECYDCFPKMKVNKARS